MKFTIGWAVLLAAAIAFAYVIRSDNAGDNQQSAEIQRTTEQEHGSAEELARNVALARKADRLARDLAAARRENEMQAAALQKANDKPDNNKELAEARQAFQQEHSRAESLSRELAAARQQNEADKPDNSKQVSDLQQALRQSEAEREKLAEALRTQTAAAQPRVDIPAAPTTASGPPAPNPETAWLMGRGRQLVEQRNITAARSVLERAAESGHPAALFALAETFDPNMLAAWGTIGTQGDADRARQLYQKALAGGMQEAAARLKALHPR